MDQVKKRKEENWADEAYKWEEEEEDKAAIIKQRIRIWIPE